MLRFLPVVFLLAACGGGDAAPRADLVLRGATVYTGEGEGAAQAIAVRERDVIAVEAVEGTDRMIERAGALCASGGWTLLKAARAGHDRRSDVPVIGPDTIRNVHKAGARCIALAADDVIIIDKPQTLELADSLGVAVFGLAPM